MSFDASYWESRYVNGETGWDIGTISEPIKAYFDQLTGKSLRILIPGGGNSYEAEYAYRNGFKNVFVIDLSQTALDNFLQRVPDFPKEQLIHDDFFNLEGSFDLIVEQTFFCALDPTLRASYARKMSFLLKPKGKLVGLLFNFPLTSEGPPFGGSKEEYLGLFQPYFDIKVMALAYNSISPRAGKELFIHLQRK